MRFFALNNMPPINVRLFHSRRKLQRKLDRDRFRCELPASKAQTVTVERGGERGYAVLIEYADASEQTIALLCHEAVHVAQGYWEDIGEDMPSSEFMAYTVQQVAQYLIEEHMAWVSGRERR